MKLKEWRERNRYSQLELCNAIEQHVNKFYPDATKKRPGQRTVCSWEHGTFPRTFWLNVLSGLTKNRVTAKDFVLDGKQRSA